MNMNCQYLGFFCFIFFSFFICFSVLFLSYFLGSQSYFYNTPHPFESGIIALGDAKLQIPIKFYLIAILFVVFDVEILYLYIWSICVRELGWIGFLEICFFVFSLLITLFYLIENRILEWAISR